MNEYLVLLNGVLEICALTKMAEVFAGYKSKRKSVLAVLLLLLMLCISAFINISGGSRIFQVFHYICLFGVIAIRYEIGCKIAVIYTVCSFLAVGILELIIYVPFNLLRRYLQVQWDFSTLVVFLTFVVCFFIEKSRIIFLGRKWIEVFRKRINIYFVIVALSVVLAFAVNMISFNEGMSLAEGVYLSVAVFMLLAMLYKTNRYQIELELHKKYQERYGEVIAEIRARQHKFMNQLNSIYSLHTIYDNYDDLVKAQATGLNNLKQYIMPNKILVLERPLVVAHIYNKLCEAEEKYIKVDTDFSCSLQNIDIPDIFLLEIIGNLLDNAMDEVLSRKKGEKIIFTITGSKNEICISVGNEHDKIPYVQFQNFFQEEYSSKGKNHGIGLPYVKKIAKKYNGRIDVGNMEIDKRNYFTIRVYFKI